MEPVWFTGPTASVAEMGKANSLATTATEVAGEKTAEEVQAELAERSQVSTEDLQADIGKSLIAFLTSRPTINGRRTTS
jgi:hypothetical protein